MDFNFKELEKIHEKIYQKQELTTEERKILAKPVKLMALLFYLLKTTYLEMYDGKNIYLNHALTKITQRALNKWSNLEIVSLNILLHDKEKQIEFIKKCDEIRELMIKEFNL